MYNCRCERILTNSVSICKLTVYHLNGLIHANIMRQFYMRTFSTHRPPAQWKEQFWGKFCRSSPTPKRSTITAIWQCKLPTIWVWLNRVWYTWFNLHATVWCNLVLSNWDLQSGITRNYNNDLVPSCVWSFSDTATCWGAQKWSKMTPPTLTTQVAANVQPCQLPSCAQVLLQKSFRIDTNHWLNKIPSINRNI